MQIVWAWDFASGKSSARNDFTVGVCMGLMNDGLYAVLDVFRGKPDFPMMKRLVLAKWVETHKKYGLCAQVYFEDASSGQQMLQEFANLNAVSPTAIQPIPVVPTVNKAIRAEAIASAQNSGLVCLPKDAPWREQFVKELSEFPLAEHDDQLDAYVWAQAGFVRGQGFFKVPEDFGPARCGAGRDRRRLRGGTDGRDWVRPGRLHGQLRFRLQGIQEEAGMVNNRDLFNAQELLANLSDGDTLGQELESILADAANRRRVRSSQRKQLKNHFETMNAAVKILLDEVRSRLPSGTPEAEVKRLARVLWLRRALKSGDLSSDDFGFDTSEPNHNSD